MPEGLDLKGDYYKINNDVCSGYILNGFDIFYLFDRLKFYEDNNITPFYQSESIRKVFYDSDKNIYLKIADENQNKYNFVPLITWFRSASEKYFNYYKILQKLGVNTSKLYACLKIKNSEKLKSVIVTEGIAEAEPAGTVLNNARSQMRTLIIREIAKTAAVIHSAGVYFSMDLRNILAKINGDDVQLFVLDLEHMKYAGFFAKRRINRNLSRFRRSLLQIANGSLDDYKCFLTHYKEFSKSRSILSNT